MSWWTRRKLNSNDVRVRREVAKMLTHGELPDDRDVDALIPALNDSDPRVREAAALALARVRPRALQPLILESLIKTMIEADSMSDYDALVGAVGLMLDAGPAQSVPWYPKGAEAETTYWKTVAALRPASVPGLLLALKTASDHHRKRAVIELLGKIGDKRAIEPLVALLSNRETREVLGSCLPLALGWLGDARAAEPLLRLYIDSHGAHDRVGAVFVSQVAALLVNVGGPAVRPLLGYLTGRHNYAAEGIGEILGEILERDVMRVASDDLRSIVTLGPVWYERLIGDPKNPLVEPELLDCSTLKQLAGQELTRRGAG